MSGPDTTRAGTPGGPIEGLPLSGDEAVAVSEAAQAVAAALPADRAATYRALAERAATGRVPTSLVDPLTRVCELTLSTGKARALGRAETERLLVAVLRRTPAGREALAGVADVNRALAQLAGKPLQVARLSWRMPGHYYLQLAVGGFDVTVAVEPDGVRVHSVQAG